MKIAAVLLALLMTFPCAAFAGTAVDAAFVPGLPPEAVWLDGQEQNDLYVEHYSCREEMITLIRKDQMPLRLFSEAETASRDKQSADAVRSIVEEVFPEAFIISEAKPITADDGFTPLVVFILSERCAGSLSIAENRIVARDITFGEYMSNGCLTYDGALKAIGFHRPGADILELEFDEDDGFFIYEGEAVLNGVEYEFEMNADNGRLLEWERD